MAIGNPVSLTSNVASKTISVIATAGQTAFTVTGGYRINQLAVFRNGVRLVDSRDYEARDGATVTLLSAASNGDSLEFQVFDSFQVADTINPYSTYQTINGNLNITGIVTAATFSVTDLDVRNITGVAATFTGQVTYEDVTNVDSIGIITARSHVSIADSILHTGDTDTAIRFPEADTFTVETAGSERFRVYSNGRVGIGTTLPTDPLNVHSASGGVTASISANKVNAYDSATLKFLGGNLSTNTLQFGDATAADVGKIVYSHDGNFLALTVNSSERVRIDSSGRIGIGTTGCAHSYIQTIFGHTTGNRAAGTIYQNATTGNDSSNGFLIGNSNGIDAYIWNYEVANIRFATSGTERLTLNPSGDVNITGVCTATQLYEGTTRVATSGKAIAMALIFG